MEMYMDYSNEPRSDIICIDVKSFYASVECVDRGYDPLNTMLVVMSNAENAGGITLAASPKAKSELGISNVSRKYDIPYDPELIVVPPRMNLYIKKNLEFLDVIREFAADEDILVYSIDECFVKVDAVKKLFGASRYEIARLIQRKVYKKMGLYTTCGIGDNLLLAKLALDNEAKNATDFKADWKYEDVYTKVWGISPITDFWGINKKTEKKLDCLGINSIYELAHSEPWILKRNMGVIGEQLYAHSWGIDRSDIRKKYIPNEKSLSNSQILSKDYNNQDEIEIVVKEMAENMAARLRQEGCKTECLNISIGGSFYEEKKGFNRQIKIEATNSTRNIVEGSLLIFRKFYEGQMVRSVGISCSKLVYTSVTQLNLFEDPNTTEKFSKVDKTIDEIRNRFGFTSLIHAHSLLEGATSIKRSKLTGGHSS